jgi:hypothetical protein
VAFRLPPLGPATRREPIGPDQGQPEPASIEPSPLEVAEQRRGERDDRVRESMAAQALQGRSEGLSPDQYAPVEGVKAGDAQIKLWRLLSGQYHYSDVSTGTVGNAEATNLKGVSTREGTRFIVRRIAVMAPKGSKLRLYLNTVVASQFIEVISNVQEFSGEAPGNLWVAGPKAIIPVIVGAEEAGQAVVRFEGDLVPFEHLSW